jgi:hypothetical protein
LTVSNTSFKLDSAKIRKPIQQLDGYIGDKRCAELAVTT